MQVSVDISALSVDDVTIEANVLHSSNEATPHATPKYAPPNAPYRCFCCESCCWCTVLPLLLPMYCGAAETKRSITLLVLVYRAALLRLLRALLVLLPLLVLVLVLVTMDLAAAAADAAADAAASVLRC